MRIAFLFLGSTFFAAMAAPQGGFGAFDPIRWRTYKSGTQSTLDNAQTFVIRTAGDWQSYWVKSTGNPAHTAPRDLDWAKEFVVAIHLGTRPTGGYSVAVFSIRAMVHGLVKT